VKPKRFKASILAGGGVVQRNEDGKQRYLVVHRPRYDDWTLPKGKLNRREGFLEAALREVREETGVRANHPVEIGSIGYSTDQGNRKVVRWWLMNESGDGWFQPNVEVDEVLWLSKANALKYLDYEGEQNVLDRAHRLAKDTTHGTIYVVRHGSAGDKSKWRDKDRKRPLDPQGRKQSIRLAANLDGHPITTILSSPAQRCVQTVRPLSFSIRMPIHTDPLLDVDATGGDVLSLIRTLAGKSAVLATHGEVVASLYAELAATGVPLDGPEEWRKGSTWVLETSGGEVQSGTHREPV
jgi:8-oxo-(d)GTP phosphatase